MNCRILCALLILLLAPAAHAWNHTGHVVTAWVAWDDMSPEARAKATAILKAHPNYERDLLEDMPEGYDQPDRWVFGRAATWPDLIRSSRHPLRNQHRGHWH